PLPDTPQDQVKALSTLIHFVPVHPSTPLVLIPKNIVQEPGINWIINKITYPIRHFHPHQFTDNHQSLRGTLIGVPSQADREPPMLVAVPAPHQERADPFDLLLCTPHVRYLRGSIKGHQQDTGKNANQRDYHEQFYERETPAPAFLLIRHGTGI
ncbi:MAG: hypothetical protein VB855_04200, partial [Pirellulaceae bacterium]